MRLLRFALLLAAGHVVFVGGADTHLSLSAAIAHNATLPAKSRSVVKAARCVRVLQPRFWAVALGMVCVGLLNFGATRINTLAARLRDIARRSVRSRIGRGTRRRVNKRVYRHHLKQQQQQQIFGHCAIKNRAATFFSNLLWACFMPI